MMHRAVRPAHYFAVCRADRPASSRAKILSRVAHIGLLCHMLNSCRGASIYYIVTLFSDFLHRCPPLVFVAYSFLLAKVIGTLEAKIFS